MTSDFDQEPEGQPSIWQFLSGLLAVVGGLVVGVQLLTSASLSETVQTIMTALMLASFAFASRRPADTRYTAPSWVVVAIALCFLLPLALLVAFGRRPGYTWPLWIFYLVSGGAGPLILLRRYARRLPPK
jgi:hypothetical protein